MKVICHGVDDDGSADDLFDRKPGGNNSAPGDPLIDKDGREIAGMHRMQTVFRIVVSSGVGKRILRISGTCPSLVDVQTEYRMLTVTVPIRNPVKGRCHKNCVADVIKGNGSPQVVVFFRTNDIRSCLWRCIF